MAVYTDISDEDLDAFIAQYDVGAVTAIKGIAEGVENSNYLLQTDTGTFILTLYEKRVNPAELPFFLGLMDHLAARGIACPTPVHGRDGVALRPLSGRPAAMVTFLQGRSPHTITNNHCARLGEALAALHRAGEGFAKTRLNDLSVTGWRPLFEKSQSRADSVIPGLSAEIISALARVEAAWPTDLPVGVIHADLFPDNVFFKGEACSGLIDFYFACTDFFAYDVAICLNAWCFERDGSFNITKAHLMLSSYRKVRPLTRAEMDALPLLAQGAALRFLLTRLYDWLNTPPGALVQPKNPMEYLKKLRFHSHVKGPGEYGLTG
ncbi:MAG: homoserine kinase [Alphaproteobacteria bacterium RIFOXYD12_FULL_60_8]|nr:MAG: homoserine kinase [Alphaproteobacteria bacterium RIFOXYD12_FULL_60_8]